MPKSSELKFSDGERVLCFHGPLMYEAKCNKADIKDSKNVYLIHYNGWNKHWDEWVPETRVLKFNDANLQKQKDLQKLHGKDKMKRGKPTKHKLEKEPVEKTKRDTVSPVVEPRKKKTRSDTTVENEESFLSKVEVKVVIPDALKPILVDDWDLITRQKQLVHLPAKKTVEDILHDYTKEEINDNMGNEASTILELCEGIKEYFNVMLGSQLLYKFERPQYGDAIEKNPNKTMSQIYGISHLMRFFVRLGSVLTYTNLEEKNMKLLITHVGKILKHIQENLSTLFNAADYEVAATEYHRRSMT